MKILSLALALLLISIGADAQNQYESTVDNGTRILKGIISRDLLEKDSSFGWYAENQKDYKPNAEALNGLKKNADSIQLIVFMGTWCGDSHYIIPKFFNLTDAAGFKANHISLIGVDRQKKTLGYLSESLNVLNVPTIIVMKNGKELGRVVEYGKSGSYDKDLGEILNK